MKLRLKIWKQKSARDPGKFLEYAIDHVSADSSFLEMLDQLNEKLEREGKEPVEFDSDCREGICGSCSLMINGQAHGPDLGTATCQLHMRRFRDGDTLTVEPWRAQAFPIVKDLVVDRSALDRIITAGGYTSAKAGPHVDANAMLVPKLDAERAMDAAACIGCGACVAACPNASAALFTGAKITQMSLLPQGRAERELRATRMIEEMDRSGFGHCTNVGECQSACPKEISIDVIATMRREYARALVTGRGQVVVAKE